MAKNPKPLRGLNTKSEIANKKMKKLAQQVKQSHKKLPDPKLGIEKSLIQKIREENKREVSKYVQNLREEKIKARAKKAKAAILKLLKEKEKYKSLKSAEMKNQLEMERYRTVYIESKLTKKIYKVPRWKAEKYETKWFTRSHKLEYKNQERLQRAERKAIAEKKLEKSTREEITKFYTGRDKEGKPTFETHKRVIEVYGLPVKEVKERQYAYHNPFDGSSRKERRGNHAQKQGNQYLKRQLIEIKEGKPTYKEEIRLIGRVPAVMRPNSPLYDPRIRPDKDVKYKNVKVKTGFKPNTEKYLVTWNEPQYEFTKEIFHFYEKIENPDPLGRRSHPKIKTDKVLHTIEEWKFVKTWKKMSKTITRNIPTTYKSILTLQLPFRKSKQMEEQKKKFESLKKAIEDEKKAKSAQVSDNEGSEKRKTDHPAIKTKKQPKGKGKAKSTTGKKT